MLETLQELGPGLILLLLVGGFAAGWVDAVVGGGGLIQLPLVLLVPGIAPVQALAANKLGSVFGTTTSAVTFYRRTSAPLTKALPMAATAFVGSFCGASVASLLPAAVFKPVILVALVAVLAFTLFKPDAGRLERAEPSPVAQAVVGPVVGLVLGAYDGILGPGTGSFLIIAMITLLGYSFLRASAQAKVVNMATNLGALTLFTLNGSVVWAIGLLLGAANMCGGYVGARSAVSQGSTFIRVVFVVVVSVLIGKMGWDVWHQLA